MTTKAPFERDQEVTLAYYVAPFVSGERVAVDSCFKTGKGKNIEWRLRVYSLERNGISGWVYQNDILTVEQNGRHTPPVVV